MLRPPTSRREDTVTMDMADSWNSNGRSSWVDLLKSMVRTDDRLKTFILDEEALRAHVIALYSSRRMHQGFVWGLTKSPGEHPSPYTPGFPRSDQEHHFTTL
jgi:predicted HNH restriction endonuclease